MSKKTGKTYSLKDYRKREVNLLPIDFHKAGRDKALKFLVFAVIVLGIGAFGYYEYTVFDETNQLETQIEEMTKKINSNNITIADQDVITQIDERIRDRESKIEILEFINRDLYDILDKVENSLNGEIYLSSLALDSQNSVVLDAAAFSNEAISYTINQLKLLKDADGEKYFYDVSTQSIIREETDDGNVLFLFQLSCEFFGGVNDETK